MRYFKALVRKERHLIKVLLLLILAGIGSIVDLSSFFALFISNKREPVLFRDYHHKISDLTYMSDGKLKIIDRNDEQISDDIYIGVFYFYNAGRQAIRREDILDQVTFTVGDTTSRVLHKPKLLKVSRAVTKIALEADPENSNQINLDFEILETGDGFAAEVMYTANCSCITVNGIVVDYTDIRNIGNHDGDRHFLHWLVAYLLAAPAIVLAVVVLKKSIAVEGSIFTTDISFKAYQALMVGVIFLWFTFKFANNLKHHIEDYSLRNQIPKTIRLDNKPS